MQDNATCHTSAATKAFLVAKKVRVVADWPPHSPDLNPIENLWSRLKDRVDATSPQTARDLEAASKAAWRGLTGNKPYVHSLFDSIPK